MENYYELMKRPIGGQTAKSKSKQPFLEEYANIMNQLNQLYTSKYGAGKYDISKGWDQQGGLPRANWGDLQEQQALSSYSKYMTDLQNVDLGMNMYNTLMQSRSQAMGGADIIREQAEKYLPQQLQMQGMGQVGASESSLIGAGGAYQRQIGNIENATIEQLANLLQSYGQAKQEGEIEYSKEQKGILQNYQDIAEQRLASLLSVTNDPKVMKDLLSNYKAGEVSPGPGVLQMYKNYANILEEQQTKDIGWTKELNKFESGITDLTSYLESGDEFNYSEWMKNYNQARSLLSTATKYYEERNKMEIFPYITRLKDIIAALEKKHPEIKK